MCLSATPIDSHCLTICTLAFFSQFHAVDFNSWNFHILAVGQRDLKYKRYRTPVRASTFGLKALPNDLVFSSDAESAKRFPADSLGNTRLSLLDVPNSERVKFAIIRDGQSCPEAVRATPRAVTAILLQTLGFEGIPDKKKSAQGKTTDFKATYDTFVGCLCFRDELNKEVIVLSCEGTDKLELPEVEFPVLPQAQEPPQAPTMNQWFPAEGTGEAIIVQA